MRYSAYCPTCGKKGESSTPAISISCACGGRVNFNAGTCEHGKQRGQCVEGQCEFRIQESLGGHTCNILILEDDLEALSKMIAAIGTLSLCTYSHDGELVAMEFAVTMLTTGESVERLINPQPREAYDVILLDRDCLLGGSFHILDIEKFGPEKIISISSTPIWNEAAKARGVKRVVLKKLIELDDFAERVAVEISDLLRESSSRREW